jgi:hypothetical protein
VVAASKIAQAAAQAGLVYCDVLQASTICYTVRQEMHPPQYRGITWKLKILLLWNESPGGNNAYLKAESIV